MAETTTNITADKLQELQQKKLENEIALQEIELKIKEKESKRKKTINPTLVTIIVALLGLAGASITGLQQRRNQLEIEEKKFHYSIYQRAMEAKDNVTAAQILDFYIKAGLLPGEQGKYTRLLEEGKTEQVPIYSGIYKNVTVPTVDHSDQLTLENGFVRGKGTEYLLAYKASERLNKDTLNTIVLHCAYAPSMKNLANFIADTLTGKASAHILIDRDGKVIQQVPFNFISYHAQKYNKSSIGIELINLGELKKTNADYLDIFKKKVDPSKVICNDSLCWEKYTDAQIETAYAICSLLKKEYHITQIVGHSEINPRKLSPGPFFPIEKFKALVR